jgi:hypothetical protein
MRIATMVGVAALGLSAELMSAGVLIWRLSVELQRGRAWTRCAVTCVTQRASRITRALSTQSPSGRSGPTREAEGFGDRFRGGGWRCSGS